MASLQSGIGLGGHHHVKRGVAFTGLLVAAYCFIASISTVAGAPPLTDPEVVLTIEPSKELPRHSEGSFAALKSGRIIFYYTEFYGGFDDHSAARITSVHSDDGGLTWSKPTVVIDKEGGFNVMSVSLLRLKSGKLAMFYLRKNSILDCTPYMRVSDDEAATWSEPKSMLEAPGYFVLNNDRVIQTEKGRLIAPLAYHRSKNKDPESQQAFDSRAIGLWLYSDDEGQTWKESRTWWGIPVHSQSGLQEPAVVQMSPDLLVTYFRTDSGVFYQSDSTNDGLTWNPPVPTELHTPTSPISIKKLPGTDSNKNTHATTFLAVFNDHSGKFPFEKGKRTPLVTALSHDNGKTWQDFTAIESDPNGWYCYTAIHFTQDAVLLAYCAGDKDVGGLNRLKIRRMTLDKINGVK